MKKGVAPVAFAVVVFMGLLVITEKLSVAAPQAPDVAAEPAAEPLAWAYGLPAAGSGSLPSGAFDGAAACTAPQGKDNGALLHVPGSSAAFTMSQIRDCFAVSDWHAEDHPAMPEIVSRGRKPDIQACAFCHYPNGKGRPEDAALAGLPTPYFEKQMRDFKTGMRTSAYPPSHDAAAMISFAKKMTDDEIEAAAEYFGSLSWTASIKVVETDRAPKTREVNGTTIAVEGSETELLGQRIVEVPANAEAVNLRDPGAGYIAYVPRGSLAKGKDLVDNGGDGRTVECDNCHGDKLTGLGVNPGIAGRSPSYTARQMYDIQRGVRKGSWVGPMTDVVAKLSPDDIVAIAAYLAALNR